MKAKPALVGPDRAVHLHAITAVDLDLAGVVDPRHAKLNHPLGLDDAFENLGVAIIFAALHRRRDRLKNFRDGLEKLRLMRVSLFDDLESFLNKRHRIAADFTTRSN